jgi:hypothetical protein
MSYNHSTLQKSDAEFLAAAMNIDRQCVINITNWHLVEDDVVKMSQLVADARNAYSANSEIDQKNRKTSEAKKYAFAVLKHALGIFINALEGNMHVPDEALALMGLRPRQHAANQPLPLPTEEPVISVVRHHDELTVYVARPEHNQPNTTVAPLKKYHGFIVRWKFEDEAEYKTAISTRLHHTLYFEQADETKRVVLAAAWVNPRLQPGPWSGNVTEVLG